MPTRLTARFTGHVQGVGFRYTTQHLASAYPVTGYVRNLPDGAVELVAEGEPPAIEAFLVDIQARLGQFIKAVAVSRSPATGEFAEFSIRR